MTPFLTANEHRCRLGLPPSENGDDLFLARPFRRRVDWVLVAGYTLLILLLAVFWLAVLEVV